MAPASYFRIDLERFYGTFVFGLFYCVVFRSLSVERVCTVEFVLLPRENVRLMGAMRGEKKGLRDSYLY